MVIYKKSEIKSSMSKKEVKRFDELQEKCEKIEDYD